MLRTVEPTITPPEPILTYSEGYGIILYLVFAPSFTDMMTMAQPRFCISVQMNVFAVGGEKASICAFIG